MRNKTRDVGGPNLWTCLAPYALLAGAGFLVGSAFAVAVNDAASGATVVGERSGVFTLVKASGTAWTAGAKLYWDDTAKAVTTVSTSNTLIGFADAAAASLDVLGSVNVTGQI